MYSANQRQQAIELRLSGKSYGDIRKMLGVRSKGTLSLWFKHLELTKDAKEKLRVNIDKATKRKLLAFNAERTVRIKKENESARASGYAQIGSLSKRDLLILGSALYWGEGTKTHGERSYIPLAFTNSDPKMITAFLRFARNTLEVPEAKFGGGINIYEGMDENRVRLFWSKQTQIPKDRLYVSRQVSKAGKGIRKTLPFGTMSIRIHDRLLFNRVMGMIDALAST